MTSQPYKGKCVAAEGDTLRSALGELLPLLLIVLLALIVYSNTFHVPFIFDDEGSIVENPVIKNLSTFLGGEGYRYNPRRFIGYLTLALNYRLGGLEVTGYHVFNLAVHSTCGILVFLLVRVTLATPWFASLTGSSASTPGRSSGAMEPLRWIPLLTALLFVAHPVQTQAVTYVVQRLASLATMFYLGALLCYASARLRQERSGKTLHRGVLLYYLMSLCCALLAMKTKEISFTLPALIVLYEFSFFGASARKSLLFLLPLALTAAVIPLSLMHAGKPLGELLSDVSDLARETRTISRGDYLLTQFSVVVTYLRLLVLPVLQNLDYDYPVYHSLFTPRVLGSFLLLLSLAAAGLFLYFPGIMARWRVKVEEGAALRLAGFGILWFFITLSVESSIIPISDVIFEHRLYLPIFGALLAFCSAAALATRRFSGRSRAFCAALVVIPLAAVSWKRNEVWGSTESLWRDAAAKAPQKARPHNNLANALTAQGRTEEAAEELRVALALKPDSASAYRNLGAAYEKKGMLDAAIEQYQAALRACPEDPYGHYNLALAYAKKGHLDPAIAELQRSIALNPQYAQAYNNLGALYGRKGMPEKALEQFQAAVRLDPELAEAHANLGFAYGKAGKLLQAEEALRRVVALQPQNPQGYHNLGLLCELKGDAAQAAANFRRALSLQPDNQLYRDALYRLQLKGYDMVGMRP